MARPLRTEEAGAIHHVHARGNRAAAVFLDDEDRHRYLRLLARAVTLRRWNILSSCLMTNHLHLLVETPEPNLGVGMRELHGDYALMFNRRHGMVGHLFQGRYGAVRIKDDAHLITIVRYIDRNPAEAGLPRNWPWSSSGPLRGSPAPPWLALDRLTALLPQGRIDLDY